MTADADHPARAHAALRLRLGLGLWIFSWLPLPIGLLELARLLGADPSNSAAHEFLVVGYTIQIVLGLAGVAIAGAETIKVIKKLGWHKTPGAVWAILRSGVAGEPTGITPG